MKILKKAPVSIRKYNFAYSDGGVRNTSLKPAECTFTELVSQLSKSDIGEKDGSYFIRGVAEQRKDEQLRNAVFVILDGDQTIDPKTGDSSDGAPDPATVHRVLCKHDMQHLIYSSHSNGEKGYRYRVLVTVDLNSADELIAVVNYLIALLHQDGVYLNSVNENYRWSQSWYLPRVPDEVAKSNFQIYYHETETEIDVPQIVCQHQAALDVYSQHNDTSNKTFKSMDPDTPIGRFIASNGNRDYMQTLLEEAGYKFMHESVINGNPWIRFLRPNSSSGQAGLALFPSGRGDWFVFSHGDDDIGKKRQALDVFGLISVLKFDDDQEIALKYVTNEYMSNLDWVSEFTLSTDEVDNILDTENIVPNLVNRSQVHAIIGEPESAKTTLCIHLSKDMASQGFDVLYVNVDISAGDVKTYIDIASESGFKLLLPELKGKTANDFVEKLHALSKSSAALSNTVLVLDTLKKFTELLNKPAAAKFYTLLRSLSAKGMTIIVLGHANKYRDEDGLPIYEGTADLLNDIDNMIYLLPVDKSASPMIVSTYLKKNRGQFEPITFEVDQDRNVRFQEQVIDPIVERKLQDQLTKDQFSVDQICKAIASGCQTKKDIISYCSTSGPGRSVIDRLLRSHSVSIQPDSPMEHYPPKSLTKLWGMMKGDKHSFRIINLEEKQGSDVP